MKNVLIVLLVCIGFSSAFAKELHVSVQGNNQQDGSRAEPFKTISAAALAAQPGDVITVHEGIYREWVNHGRSNLL